MPDDAGQAGARCARFLLGFLKVVAGIASEALPAQCVRRRALTHKFSIGSTVYFTASNVARPAASGTYEVVRLLPTDGDDCQYRIKSSTEAFERVAKESQLALS
jgi:hypothetical protein